MRKIKEENLSDSLSEMDLTSQAPINPTGDNMESLELVNITSDLDEVDQDMEADEADAATMQANLSHD